MLPAVPHSFLRYAMTSCTGFFGGMYSETSSVPLPSLLESSEIAFLILYNLTESALLSKSMMTSASAQRNQHQRRRTDAQHGRLSLHRCFIKYYHYVE